MTVIPNACYFHRPICEVVKLEGPFRGNTPIPEVRTFAEAHAVLLRYPDDSTAWHAGPASPDHAASAPVVV